LKPYFNDFVVHGGHAFGFDGSLLACIDLADGKRKWKGGRYGHGQMILLPDQDLLLVLSEKGELALIAATPDQFRNLRVPGDRSKTWNHPVLAATSCWFRNDQEMPRFDCLGRALRGEANRFGVLAQRRSVQSIFERIDRSHHCLYIWVGERYESYCCSGT